MWCRTILTAVAISYVICMLLWSGLQNDDLDAGTMEKLRRYNVNIDDMNNEQLRQECLLDYVTTEVQRETLSTSGINERNENDVTVGIYPKIGMLLAANFEDKTVVQNEVNNNTTKGNIDELAVVVQKKPDLGNATNVERNKGIIKIEYNIQNQPDVESVMNFWTKLTRHTMTVVTTLPTTLVAPVTLTEKLETQKARNVTATVQAETHNNGYVHSREMEYVSRILAEYLASQTVPTTTLRMSTKKASPNYAPIKYWEISNKASVEEKPKVNEKSNEINKINNATQDDLRSAKAVYNSLLDEIKSMPFKVTYDDSIQLLKRAQETSSSLIQSQKPKVRESKPVKQNNPIGILQRLLQTKNDLFNNGVLIPETHSNGYVHSREMEYVSRILAEYLASQTVPTTTLRMSTKKVFPNYAPIKYWEISNKASVEEKPKVNEQSIEINKINNATQDDLHSAKTVYNYLLDEIKSMPFKVTYDDSIQLLKRTQETPPSLIQSKKPKVRETKPIKKNNPLGILQRLLHMKNDLFNNGVLIPETESSTESIQLFTNKSNEQQDKSESFHLLNIVQNMNDVNKNNVKNDQSKSASIKTETWEPVPESDVKIDKEFKASLIGKKETEQTQNFNTNINRIEVIPPDIKKWKLHKNSDVEYKGSRFQAMPSIKYSKQNKNLETTNNQQPAAKEKFARNQLFKMKNDTYKADSGIISNITQNSKEFNGKQIKKAPVFQNWEPTHDSKKTKAIQEIINNFDRDNEQLKLVNESSPKTTQNFDSMNISDVQGIPANIIKEIAEKVKQMVLKDIVDDVTTTKIGTTSSMNSTTAAPTTISSSSMTTTISLEKPLSTLQKKFTQANNVMQKLMEIFKELKAMKDTMKLTSKMPQNTTAVSNGTTRLPVLPIQLPQAVLAFNPYLMPNPPVFKPIQTTSYTPRIVPVPISSGVNPPQNNVLQYMLPLNVQPTKDYHFGAITIQTNSDEIAPLAIQISKPLKHMNQHVVLTTKRTVDKLKKERERDSIKRIDEKFRIPKEVRNDRETIELQSDLPKHIAFSEKHENRDRYPYRGGRYMDREKPRYNHEYQEKVINIENTHPVRSRFPELHYPGRLSHLEHISRPKDLSNSEDLILPSRGYSRPGFNEPGTHQNGIRHHPGSYGHSDYDRKPRYKATKFHEKLERIDNWPRSRTWKDFQSPSDSSNDEISARQQMPLMKVKQRTRYDDSHFTKFMKSQQKVTDMLEKLLANNVKNSGPHSVETP